MPKIYLIDVTNRDGVQTSRICLSKLQKTILNLYLNQLGVFQSEFGFPTTHHETNYLNANLELAGQGVLSPLRLGGWIRAIEEDVRETFKNCPNIRHLNLSMSTSEQMIRHKFKGKLDHASVIKEMFDAVKAARELGAESIGVNAEDASRTEIGYLVSFAQAAKEAGNMVDLDSNPTKLIEIVEIGKQLLMTRGSLTTFSICNDVAKYFAILPAMFAATYPVLNGINIMRLTNPQSAVLAAVIFNALIIIALIPLALRGVAYRPLGADAVLRRNLLIYGLGGLVVPFPFIWGIDRLLVLLRLA